MTHAPICVLADPCEPDHPAHGYCGFTEPRFCIHCSQWCICERLAKVRADERDKAAERVEAISEGLRLDPDHVSTVLLLRYAPAAARGEAQ